MSNEPGNTEVPKLTRRNLAKHTNELLRSMASKDVLTGLKNKTAFQEDWKRAHSFLQRGEMDYRFLFLDLDKFKPINDVDSTHTFGDEILTKVADAFRKMIRPEDTVARIGGDEFAVIIEGNEFEENSKIQNAFEERFKRTFQETVGEDILSKYPQLRNLGVSVGVAEPDFLDTFVTIYQRADALMYQRKNEKGEAR